MLKYSTSIIILLIILYKCINGFPVGPRDGIEIPPPEVVRLQIKENASSCFNLILNLLYFASLSS